MFHSKSYRRHLPAYFTAMVNKKGVAKDRAIQSINILTCHAIELCKSILLYVECNEYG